MGWRAAGRALLGGVWGGSGAALPRALGGAAVPGSAGRAPRLAGRLPPWYSFPEPGPLAEGTRGCSGKAARLRAGGTGPAWVQAAETDLEPLARSLAWAQPAWL